MSLIVSQLGMCAAMAAPATATTASVTPEFSMLANVIALKGQNLSKSATQSQLQGAVSQYLASAPKAGQQERLAQAFVDLGVYSQGQAQQYVAAAEASAEKATSKDNMVAEIGALAKNLRPVGAQFSVTECEVGGTLAIAGAITLIVGIATRFDNPTCSTPTYNTDYYDQYGYAGSSTTYGPTTCDVADYYPHAQAGDNEMIAGGVVAAIGGLLLYLGQDGC